MLIIFLVLFFCLFIYLNIIYLDNFLVIMKNLPMSTNLPENEVTNLSNDNSQDIKKQGGKLDYLNSIETPVNNFAEVDIKSPKYFITFPYPYMNGKLHLGHLYSFSKSDFTAYYKKMCGYNVLFPFAFHCTGMPISASAAKLAEELAGKPIDLSVKKILSDFGFDDPTPFTDPNYWIKTFPGYGKRTLTKYHSMVDWRRSFITTSLNKYYDSFIRFQFACLKKGGYLDFGKRYSIFCTVDNQACLDHDRRKGEGVKPIEVMLRKIVVNKRGSNNIDTNGGCSNKGVLLARCSSNAPAERVFLPKSTKLVEFEYMNNTFIVEEGLYNNIKYQVEGTKIVNEEIGEIVGEEIPIEYNDKINVTKVKHIKEQKNSEKINEKNSEKTNEKTNEKINEKINEKTSEKINEKTSEKTNKNSCLEKNEFEILFELKNEKFILLESDNFIKIYEPESPVISRAGSNCVVSLLDQWYIDYGKEDWKENVRKCVKMMNLTQDSRSKLEDSVEWINKWGFSRSFGLGTRVPWDEQFLIDSLSDSTIYMAFYTFKHLLFRDLQGDDEIFPSNLLCEEMWHYIFNGVFQDKYISIENRLPASLIPYKNILDECRNSLKYFYGVDLRVSGKDLIGNHLTFFIFNHIALFKEEFWPKRIFTNGYIMLNSAKMSKSEGNFLSADDAMEKYGTSATRMCLALCGDTNEDANFEEKSANSLILKLYTFMKSIEALEKVENVDEFILKMVAKEVEGKDVGMSINKNDKILEAATGVKNIVDDDTLDEEMTDKRVEKVVKEFCSHLEFNPKAKFVNFAFLQIISYNSAAAILAYESMAFRDVVKYAFYENIHAIEQYICMGGDSKELIFYAYRNILQLIYPIVPSLSKYALDLKFNGAVALPTLYTSQTNCMDALEHVKKLCTRLVTGKKDRTKVLVNVCSNYPDWKIDIMSVVDQSRESVNVKSEIINKSKQVFEKYSINPKKGLVFAMDYLKNPKNYSVSFNEVHILTIMKDYIENISGLDVVIYVGDKGEPMNPFLEFFK